MGDEYRHGQPTAWLERSSRGLTPMLPTAYRDFACFLSSPGTPDYFIVEMRQARSASAPNKAMLHTTKFCVLWQPQIYFFEIQENSTSHSYTVTYEEVTKRTSPR